MDGSLHPPVLQAGNWREIGSIDDIPRLGARTVSAPGGDIAVFRTADDQVFALNDLCPHKAGKLSQGIVHGHSVTCPLHGWVIGLGDGVVQAPDAGCVHRVAVKVEDRRILLQIPA